MIIRNNPKFKEMFEKKLVTYYPEVSDADTWQEYRRVRNMFLEQSDWTQNSDNTLTPEQREAWRVYRQQLRDLPDNHPDPKTVVWPTKPE